MSRTLLAFNPEVQSHSGDILLFGVALPRPVRAMGLPALEELNLASHFLEAQSPSGMAPLLEYVINRSAADGGRPIDPRVAISLRQRLTRAAAVVRDALRPDVVEGSPLSPEAIFGSELEGLSPEDREFETAHRFIRLAGEISRAAARAGRGMRSNLLADQIERRLAPGLARSLALSPGGFRNRRHSRRTL
jgi:hypothetical protein